MISATESRPSGRQPSVPMTLGEIERQASGFAEARGRLETELAELKTELEAAKKRRIRRIKELVAAAGSREAELRASVESAPDLFKRPKTLTLHGIKVGYRTGSGKIVFDDSETVIKLIRRHLADREELLVRTREDVDKNGLKTLQAVELAKIGCRIEGAGEQVVVTAADDEVDKLVGKLIEDMVEASREESAEG